MFLKIYWKPVLWLLVFYVSVCTVLRIALLLNPVTTAHFYFIDYVKIFVGGALNDALIFVLLGTLLWLYLLFLSDGKFKKPFGYIIFGLLVALLCYLIFFNNILKQYGNVVPLIGILFVSFKTLLFGLMLFFPKLRKPLRTVFYFITVLLFAALILLNALSEYYFWNEFGVRYNFIAVDYLIYTNEVIGNIMESYPVVPLFTMLGIIALAITFWIVYKTRVFVTQLPTFFTKIKITVIYGGAAFLSFWLLPLLSKMGNTDNMFASELQSDGVYKFCVAFIDNDLNYFKFYSTINQAEAFRLLKNQLPGLQGKSTLHEVKDSLPEIHKNVVLITVESLSEDYLQHYGNSNHLTPFLDSLADESMFFTNLYAVGNRTVRGLEAVTLCIPPAPGESIIKRKGNENKFSTGFIFKQKGYQVKFLYGGYSYFDNMRDFYEGNGYDIVDRNNFAPNEISFANIWGVCDEDMAKKAIKTMNAEAATGRPFFNHWMTVSNHRPFTYPNGKIDIPGDAKSREGGVKYTDYALRRFFEVSEKQAWFHNTVFIIVADHCASSSGKTALPMSKYRIPCIVYSPGFIVPQQVDKLMSQIDIMPTVMSLLHFSYSSKFIGQNVLDANYKPRAFIATYEDMGFVKNDTLTVLSPVREVKQYHLAPKILDSIEPQFQYQYKEVPVKNIDKNLQNETVSYYQTSAWLMQNGKFQNDAN
ncbi:sulfatase [Arachidicoccus ginsenosidimutans]|uniref:LTA synthase family protein n=1 Tax=Arachidicoccus sp. BS20 TaxID=1850526 RepID=UPI0007F06985|nr:alkaline phosphatase family protein [Arachidicoccus sp. BS20]ANI87940.1 sulfatase [Arachidicoccus sp. BS20]